MYDVNVLGILHTTQALLPALRASQDGLIVTVGSTAGRTPPEPGAGYVAAKHGPKVVTKTPSLAPVGEPIRIRPVAPGMVRSPAVNLARLHDRRGEVDAVRIG